MTKYNYLAKFICGVLSVTGTTLLAVSLGTGQTNKITDSARLTDVDGSVTVNGNSVGKGATILSDTTMTTAHRSSAVVSLGKLGRVEVLPETNSMKLSFTATGISVAMLSQGRVRVSTSSGVNSSTTTNDGVVNADTTKKAEYIVDTMCGNTHVKVKSGKVELRVGGTVKQIAAGGQDTAGQARPGCTRKS